MLKKYRLFDGFLGCVNGVTATLKLKDNAEPKSFKARQAPYALKYKIEQEIHRLGHGKQVIKSVNKVINPVVGLRASLLCPPRDRESDWIEKGSQPWPLQ